MNTVIVIAFLMLKLNIMSITMTKMMHMMILKTVVAVLIRIVAMLKMVVFLDHRDG